MKLFKLLTVILILGFVVEFPTQSPAQLTRITTSYVSDSAGVLPLWIAKDTGIFARNGLEVQAVRVHASVGMMALLSGELQFVLASGPVVVESALRGSNAVYVACGMSTLDFALVSRPEIKPPLNSKAPRSVFPRLEAPIRPRPASRCRNWAWRRKTFR